MSSYKNPTDLIARYLQAVRFWMPKTKRQEDLLAELGEDLHSQVDARQEELGHDLDQAEVSEILKRCGAPFVVASRLGPQRYVIGPALYPVYIFVLKMVLFWMMVPLFIFILGPINFANTGDWASAFGMTIGNLWSALFISAGIITLVFAAIERAATIPGTSVHAGNLCAFDPTKLPPLEKERTATFTQAFAELVFNVFGFVWLLLLPNHHWMILGPAAAFLAPAPIWHRFFPAFVLLAVVAVLRLAIALARPRWTWFPVSAQLAQTVVSIIILKFVIDAAGQPTGPGWYPFVVLADSARNAPHYLKIAAVVNVSIMISVVGAWVGLSIAGMVQTWQLLKYLRKRIMGAQQATSLQVL